ncbi:GntR family transcriptional regulator [Planococcus donghaensis MPA1U2]|uniref:GntR family transcriptional regulator n=1 Tax=Planococcus donghaensis MPA1U2 TaxID=933115 RepID=E7RKX3_9BACL|nr:GntR family transcriptional regulator [Planococcus donghaensis]EGA88367.1 GntR family transcriptional regulator [Planococcus donghaensis MPA1U2]
MEKITKQATLADRAYEYIKKMIITGELKPGQELPEEKLAYELGISRTPLREALKRLAMDALIELRNLKPAVVAAFTSQDIIEIMELRRLLEIKGLENLTDVEQRPNIDELMVNIERQLQAVQEKKVVEFMDLDQEFHALLYQNHRNNRLKEMINTINSGGSRAFLLLSDTATDSSKKAYEEHLSILQAIEQGDLKKAKQQLGIHLDNIENRLLKYSTQEEL